MEELEFVKNSTKMSQDLFNILGVEFEDSTEFDRQALAAFSFGMVTAFAQEKQVEQDIVLNTSGYVLVNVFKYSKEQMQDFIHLLINSTKKGYHEGFFLMINQGVEMYREYEQKEYDKIFDRIMKTYLMFKKR